MRVTTACPTNTTGLPLIVAMVVVAVSVGLLTTVASPFARLLGIGGGCLLVLVIVTRRRANSMAIKLAIAGIWVPPLVSLVGYMWATGSIVDAGYMELRILEFVGLGIGSTLFLVQYTGSRVRSLRWPEQRRILLGVYAFGLACGMAFLVVEGSPLLSGQAESARAAAGAAYLRVPAHLVLPAVLLLYSARDRLRRPLLGLTLLIISALGNRSPLVYLLGCVVLIDVLHRKDSFRRLNVRFAVRALLGVAAVIAVVLAGAVLRVLWTSEFRTYDEFRRPIAESDYPAIAQVSLRHYAAVVGDNLILTKRLVDEGRIEHQAGRSYLMPFMTSLPGKQETLDLTIKRVSGSTFIGGGTPPTLSGEGYANFGPAGSIIGGLTMGLLIAACSLRFRAHGTPTKAAILAFVVMYGFMAQVAGFAGASGVPLLTLIGLFVLDSMGCSGLRGEREVHG